MDEKNELLLTTSNHSSDVDIDDASSFASASEDAALLGKESQAQPVDEESQQPPFPASKRPSSLIVWIIINIIATILIVSCVGVSHAMESY